MTDEPTTTEHTNCRCAVRVVKRLAHTCGECGKQVVPDAIDMAILDHEMQRCRGQALIVRDERKAG